MGVLEAATRHLITAKSSLIRCGIELQKLAVPMEHGLRLMQMVQHLDKIQHYMQSSIAREDESASVHAKPKKRSRLRKKQDQSTPVDVEIPVRPVSTQQSAGVAPFLALNARPGA